MRPNARDSDQSFLSASVAGMANAPQTVSSKDETTDVAEKGTTHLYALLESLFACSSGSQWEGRFIRGAKAQHYNVCPSR